MYHPMKRFTIIVMAMMATSTMAWAQQFEQVKTYLILNQLSKAKDALQEIEKKGKAATKPEFFLAKATVFSGMMRTAVADTTASGAAMAIKYLDESMASFKRYLELDPTNASKLLDEQAYAATAFSYYSFLFNKAIVYFNAKKYAEAAATFARTVEWSDYLIKNKQLASEFDTTLYLYAGASCQMSDNSSGAMANYAKISDRKVSGKDFLDVYRYMTYMYFLNRDKPSFEKLMSVAKELYPSEEMFKMEEVDFILELEDETEKMTRLEEKVAKEPENVRHNEIYGSIMFDKLNKRDKEESSPSYAADEQKMLAALTKTATAKPEDGTPNFLIGKHYWYKTDGIRNYIQDMNDSIRIFNNAQKPDKYGKTPPPPKHFTARRDSLRKQQEAIMDMALPYLLKAQPIMAQTHTKTKGGTQNYKSLLDDLIQYYGFKRQYAKTNLDKSKAEAEEKKWDLEHSKLTP